MNADERSHFYARLFARLARERLAAERRFAAAVERAADHATLDAAKSSRVCLKHRDCRQAALKGNQKQTT